MTLPFYSHLVDFALLYVKSSQQVEFDDNLLSSGLIQISQLRLWLEDGSLIDTQCSELPSVPRELDPSQLAGLDVITVVIALPLMQPGVINVQQESVLSDRPLRYREEWVTVQDVFGAEEESMAVARFNYSIRFAHESNESWKTCPVARLIRDGQGGWRQDPVFIPPLALFSASPTLRERLVLLNRAPQAEGSEASVELSTGQKWRLRTATAISTCRISPTPCTTPNTRTT